MVEEVVAVEEVVVVEEVVAVEEDRNLQARRVQCVV